MTAGHFGLAAAVKSPAPRIPLWALMFATYLLDIVFIVLNVVGVESFAPMDPAHPAYGETLIQAYYSHSLVGAALIAGVAALVASRAWGRRGGVVIGAVVFSHWILDLIVHRPDLPILPGNAGNLPLLGFGLWQVPLVSAAVELALVLAGAYLYYQSTLRVTATFRRKGEQRTRALTTTAVTGLLLLLLLLSDILSLSVLSVFLIALLIVLCGWLDSRLAWGPVTA
ncbi:MAG TPA: permease [Anaerolineae bacterium]